MYNAKVRILPKNANKNKITFPIVQACKTSYKVTT